jgi:uncharacterized protein (TIGR02466 family)
MLELSLTMSQVQKLIQSGNFRHATELLNNIPEKMHDEPLHSTMLGWSLFNSGEHEKGIEILSITAEEYPQYFEAQQFKGAVLNYCGELEKSLVAFQQAGKIQPENAAVKINIGATCIGLGKVKEALNAFKQAVSISPDNPDAHGCLANVLAEMGQYEEAYISYQHAIKLAPTHAQNLINYAMILQSGERHEEALNMYERAEQSYASSPQLYKGECKSLKGLEEIDAAIQIYQQALNLFPDSSELMEDYCYTLAEFRSVKKALHVCDKFMERNGTDIRMLAVKCVLLNEANETEKLSEILDFDSRLGRFELDAPDASTTKDGFIQGLVDEVLNHSTLMPSPRSHATRYGSHTGELFAGNELFLSHLKSQLYNAAQTYIKENTSVGDVFSELKPENIRIRGWSVVMDTQGYQLSHIHPSAWLSGVCYLQLPDVIGDTEDHQGWLEFGSYPPDYNGHHGEAKTKLIKPEVGSVVVFPSYFWHRTIPYESDKQRISLAFDVIA